ncbi:protein hypothetical protein [Limosa lapponica baueri]|uniref:Protein fam107b n=1 Tax=Limosa lapponica baueri TaxID=1758121 RepID=A0A2I0T4P5_LIMLA|nr:protein hypothetical protein [Limosa lapponica baueri]
MVSRRNFYIQIPYVECVFWPFSVDLLQFPPCFTDTVNKDTEPKDPYPIPRKIMAEPDYIDDDNPELIRPQKLINPVKSSRNHQDLHRELLMNQKR